MQVYFSFAAWGSHRKRCLTYLVDELCDVVDYETRYEQTRAPSLAGRQLWPRTLSMKENIQTLLGVVGLEFLVSHNLGRHGGDDLRRL